MLSYNNLWKILIDRNLKRTDLIFYAGVTSNVIASMGKNKPVPRAALEKIAHFLECDVEDLVTGLNERYSNVSSDKEYGVVYTPTCLANYVAHQLVINSEIPDSIRILDPAIGGGELVISLIKSIRERSSARIECVGFELDSKIIDVTKQRIEDVSPNVQCKIHNVDFIEACFSEKIGLFDYIIANPPYIRTQIMGSEKSKKLAQMLGLTGRVDIYYAFMVISSSLLVNSGVAGFITSNKFLSIKAGASTRMHLVNHTQLIKIVDFGDTKLFEASVLPCVTIFSRGNTNQDSVQFTTIYEVASNPKYENSNLFDHIDLDCTINFNGKSYHIKNGCLKVDEKTGVWSLSTRESSDWLNVVQLNTYCKLSDVAKIRVGIKTTADPIFIMPSWNEQGDIPELARPLITHRNAGQIVSKNQEKWLVIYPHYDDNGKTRAVNLQDYPLTQQYLEKNREKLESRKYVKDAGRNWFEIWVPQKAHIWSKKKVVFRDISDTPQFWFDDSGSIVNGDCYWIDFTDKNEDFIYLSLGVFNSPLIETYYDMKFNTKLYSGKRRYMSQFVEQFPLPNPQRQESKELIALVKQYICSSPDDQAIIKSRMNSLVFSLFGFNQRNHSEEGVESSNS